MDEVSSIRIVLVLIVEFRVYVSFFRIFRSWEMRFFYKFFLKENMMYKAETNRVGNSMA